MKFNEDKLVPILEKAIQNSEHYLDGKLAKERLEVLKYYNGELPRPLHAGDSKYVSRDVFDAVDSMRSTILEAYLTNHRIVRFKPEQGETVQDAKAATEFARHAFFKQNCGETVLYDVVTDGLTKRMSFVKVYAKDCEWEDEYEFEALTSEELEEFVAPYEDFEFADHELTEEGLYSGTLVVPRSETKIVVETIQPEDILVSSRSADIRDSKYVIHRYDMTRADLQKRFPDANLEKITWSTNGDLDWEYEKQDRFEQVDDIIQTDDAYQEDQMETTVYEFYMHYAKSGRKTKLYRIIYAGRTVIDMVRVPSIPIVGFVPLPVPHTWFGENFAKNVIPVQNARTVLIRQIINHSLITNNPRMQVLNGTVQNPRELQENRLGGLVNVRRMDGLAPIPQAPLNPYVFNLIGMIDEDKEEVTGISKLSQGMNKEAISTQNAEGMVDQLIGQSQQRNRIIARRFGLFIQELFLLINNTAVEHVDAETIIEISGEQMTVTPSDWQERKVASVELTLGANDAAKEAAKWDQIDQRIKADPILSAGYDYAKSYEVASRALEARGIEDIGVILTPPDQMKPPEPSEAEKLQVEQMKAQIALQNAQAQSMVAKAETDRMNAQAKLLQAKAQADRVGDQTRLEAKELDHTIEIDNKEIELAAKAPEQRAVYNPEA